MVIHALVVKLVLSYTAFCTNTIFFRLFGNINSALQFIVLKAESLWQRLQVQLRPWLLHLPNMAKAHASRKLHQEKFFMGVTLPFRTNVLFFLAGNPWACCQFLFFPKGALALLLCLASFYKTFHFTQHQYN